MARSLSRSLLSRRAFLQASGAALLAGCQATRWAGDWWGAVASGRVVDTHCHIFNADDLAVKGFIHNVVLRDFGRVGRALGRALDYALQRGAPGFEKENALLDDLLSGRAFAEFEVEETDEELLGGFLEELREDEPALYDEMLQEVQPGAPDGFTDEEAEAGFIDTVVMRVLRWGRQLTFYRVQIAQKMLETYPEVDLFTPALVDMDRWISDQASVGIPEQIVLNGKISRWSEGRLHPLAAFDPRREAEAPKDEPERGSLHWAKLAVREHGAAGVKLYPPMGFRPTDNAAKPGAGAAERALDEALEGFYVWCESEDVPVMAHCNRSNGASEGSEEDANPRFWRRVLKQHPSLRLDLGHFGGTGETDWPNQIAALMQDFAHVYADLGFHDVALDAPPKEVDDYLRRLADLRAESPRLDERALYGSDWQMIVTAKNHEAYLETYTSLYRDAFGGASTRRFLGENALRFLGLAGGDTGNRRRLAAFYATHGIPEPGWWSP